MLLPEIKKVSNNIEQNFWLQELSKKLKVREEDLEAELGKIKIESVPYEQTSYGQAAPKNSLPEICQKPRKELLEEELLVLILARSQVIADVQQEMIEVFDLPIKDIISKIKEDPQITQEDLQKQFKGAVGISDLLNRALLRSDIEKEQMEAFDEDFKACLEQIEKMQTKEALNKLSFEIKDAERSGELDRSKDLIAQFNNLAKKLNK
jgi:translation initiation factor 2 beta subunit (eIF-2beta)/eIF-5